MTIRSFDGLQMARTHRSHSGSMWLKQERCSVNKNNDLTGNENTVVNELAVIDDLEICPLTDEELDAVAGGWNGTHGTTVASCACCMAGGTNPPPNAR
jgi:hypothetical protein